MPAFTSLRKLTLAFLLAFTAAVAGTGWLIHRATLDAIDRLVDQRITLASDAILGPPPHRLADILARIALTMDERATGDLGISLTDRSGRAVAGNIRLLRGIPPGMSRLTTDDRITGLTAGRAYARPVGGGMVLTVVAETEPFDNYGAARVRIYLLGFGSIALVVVGGLMLFAHLINGRVAAMRRTADAIVAGDMQRRVPTHGSRDAFDEQAIALNHMLDRIAELMAGISNLSNDIAHDLRTPLARLRGRLALLAGRAAGTSLAEEIEAAIAQSDELLAMFAAVMRIAEVQGGERRAAFAALDLGALAQEVTAMMEPVIADAGHRLAVGPLGAAPVRGDRQLLIQALMNLLENAIRHTPPGSRIAVATGRTATGSWLTVADDGPGIPPADHALALRRFGRLDTSRTREGHGLGLPLVAAIARLHGGTLALEEARPGLRVRLSLPPAEETTG